MNTAALDQRPRRPHRATARAVERRSRGASVDAPVAYQRRRPPADAPALHALIAAHLEEGHLLPRALERARRCTRRASSSRRLVRRAARRRLRGAGAAQRDAWRRCDRSSSIDRRGRAASAARLVDELQRRARVDGFETAVRVHARRGVLRPQGLLHRAARLGAGEDRLRLPSTARCSAAAASTRSCCRSLQRGATLTCVLQR